MTSCEGKSSKTRRNMTTRICDMSKTRRIIAILKKKSSKTRRNMTTRNCDTSKTRRKTTSLDTKA